MKVTTTTKSDKSVWFRKNVKWYSYEESYSSKEPKKFVWSVTRLWDP